MGDPVQTAPGPPYQPGQLAQGINGILRAQNAQLGSHAGELLVANPNAGTPGAPVTGTIREMPSDLESFGRALGEGSVGDILKNVFKMGLNAFSIATGQGFGFIASNYQALKFNNALKQFEPLGDLEPVVRQVDADLSGAADYTQRLADLARNFPGFDSSAIRELLHRKKYLGDGLAGRIDDAIAAAKTPEDRARLEALKKNVQDWTAKRDSTVKAEIKDYGDLDAKMAVTGHEAYNQKDSLEKASQIMQKAISGGPIGSNGIGFHLSPQALFFVGAMRQTLMGARTRLTQGINTVTQGEGDV